MKTIPYRGLSKGVITDIPPYNLELGAWSWGQNVRFRNNSVTRSPVFRDVKQSLSQTNPRFLGAIFPSSGFDQIIIGYLNGRVSSFVSGSETDYSVTGFVNNTSEGPFTDCIIGDVYYLNRSDRAPWALLPGSTSFEVLPNWAPSEANAPWTCNILRASNNALVALNVTQNGVANPTMVITSEFALEGAVPSSWDYTLGTNNATQNVLGEMVGPITDACSLGSTMVIYGQTETWLMSLSGDDNIWNYNILFKDLGAINANCAVEVDRKHFVFGLNDIWMHDGNSKTSICDERTREFIFNGLNVTNANRCAVVYNHNLKEVYFRYMSSDGFTSFSSITSGLTGCNRQAVYHIPTGTWSFDDLPFVYGAAMANLDISKTWSSDTQTWAGTGGTWASLADSEKRVMAMIGDVSSVYNLTESLYAFDLQGPGSQVTYPVDTNATKGWTLIRDGIDLDQLGADLVGYKVISSIIPQIQLENGAEPVSFTVGTADYYDQPTFPGNTQTYSLYDRKLDFNMAGRYGSITITHNDYHWMNFTAMDFVIDVLAEF